MSAATIEQVDLADLVGDITPRCESIFLDLLRRRVACPNPAAWLACCPCGEGSTACKPCHDSTIREPFWWVCEVCGRGPRTWTWRSL